MALDGWKQSNYAILAYGENFPDALTAAPLAKKYNAPILLTETNSIPTDTLNVIQQLKVSEIFIIGGTGVISSSVENQLTSLGVKTTRLSGQDRYETSISVAYQLENVSEITIVTGEDFADALSISPIAAKRKMPIILVPHNVIPDIVKEYIKLHKISKTYVIGVGSSLDESLVSELPNVEQINGQDKYQRNLAVIDKFKSEMDLNAIYLTTGETFADGLSGSALASVNCNPLLLVGENSISQKYFLNNNSIINYNIVVLGGVTEMAIIGSTNVDYEEKKISDVINIKSDDNITKIVFYDGRGGRNEPLTIEDKQKIKEFMGYLDGYVIKKEKNPVPSAGWIHKAVFYINDKEAMSITFVDPMIIDGKYYYNIIKGNLDTDKIDKFLKSIDPEYIIGI
ncbi:cell wall-binding repeat-containing protein [Desulfosporosinus nitroreducens]|uniref:cell wall-binding repeat-containing protein n=1 Tax=Desulfosporosinus nitroreducens TaxID=2018668 RepID=UPI0028528E13|nr:cell wall-binding repeat-containing protein [Desulfosporosinus nitroreducens]